MLVHWYIIGIFSRMKTTVVLLLTWVARTLQGGAHWNYLVSETNLKSNVTIRLKGGSYKHT